MSTPYGYAQLSCVLPECHWAVVVGAAAVAAALCGRDGQPSNAHLGQLDPLASELVSLLEGSAAIAPSACTPARQHAKLEAASTLITC